MRCPYTFEDSGESPKHVIDRKNCLLWPVSVRSFLFKKMVQFLKFESKKKTKKTNNKTKQKKNKQTKKSLMPWVRLIRPIFTPRLHFKGVKSTLWWRFKGVILGYKAQIRPFRAFSEALHTHTPTERHTQKNTLANTNWDAFRTDEFLASFWKLKNTEFFWEIKVRNSRQWGQKQRKIFCQRSPDRSEELKAERCQESSAF